MVNESTNSTNNTDVTTPAGATPSSSVGCRPMKLDSVDQ